MTGAGDTPKRTIWVDDDGRTVVVIDQTLLPHVFATEKLATLEDAAVAIETMVVRGGTVDRGHRGLRHDARTGG